MPVFGVRVSVTFHPMFVHNTFSSVWVAEWPPFGKELPARLAVCSHCILSICNFSYFPSWFRERGLVFDCSGSCLLLTCYFHKQVVIVWILSQHSYFSQYFRINYMTINVILV